jgi:hypothetical protein
MIHSILQQIFFARQALSNFGSSDCSPLKPDTLFALEASLHRWQEHWEITQGSSINSSSPNGPISSNAIAPFRIAYIRLNADLGAHRRLETRDHDVMVQAFCTVPHLARSVHVCRAMLQSAHSLSIPVRMGLEFIARTQTLSWSVVHSLCSLECAIFLSQWLNCMATKTAEGQVTNANKKRLVNLIDSILQETNFVESINIKPNGTQKYSQMAAAIYGSVHKHSEGTMCSESWRPLGNL